MMNRRLAPGIETVFMMPAENLFLPELPYGEGNCRTRRIGDGLVPDSVNND